MKWVSVCHIRSSMVAQGFEMNTKRIPIVSMCCWHSLSRGQWLLRRVWKTSRAAEGIYKRFIQTCADEKLRYWSGKIIENLKVSKSVGQSMSWLSGWMGEFPNLWRSQWLVKPFSDWFWLTEEVRWKIVSRGTELMSGHDIRRCSALTDQKAQDLTASCQWRTMKEVNGL